MSSRPDLEKVFDRHERIAFSFSGGKDSLAVLHLLRPHLDRMTVYHLDTGDLLPEMVEHVARHAESIPHFVRIETHVDKFIEQYGLPTDLMPYSAHTLCQAMGEPKTKLVSRYVCCWNNLMLPLYRRVIADGCTLLIRGTKQADMIRLPISSGESIDGVEFLYPLQSWTNLQVRAYLAVNGITLPPLYAHFENAPECARCPAWLGEGRARFLQEHYPDLFDDYDQRLQRIIDEVAPVLANLRIEAGVA